MDNTKPQYSHNLKIQKSTAILFIRLVLLELSLGILYLLLRIGFRFLDLQLDTEFSLNSITLAKSTLFMIAEIGMVGFFILQWINNYYVLSSTEIIYITGIISKKEKSYSLESVQSVTFEQGLIGRVLNYGNVKIYSPALQQELILTEVPNPSAIAENIKIILRENTHKPQFIKQSK